MWKYQFDGRCKIQKQKVQPVYDAILMQVLHYIGHFLHHRPRLALRKELLPGMFAVCIIDVL